jgi:O-antigen ligase
MKVMNQTSPISVSALLVLPVALVLGVVIGALNPLYTLLFSGALLLVIIYMLRLDAPIAAAIVAVHIVIDAFMGFAIYQPALLLALGLLTVCYLGRSSDRPWTAPNLYWLWLPFLLLMIVPTLEGGAFSLTNSIGYYLPIVLSGFVMFWIGNLLGKDEASIRFAFQCIAMMAAILSIHTIIEATTGVFLLKSLGKASAATATFTLDTGNSRLGSFFLNPNGNGMFLATSFFLPLGLFLESKSFWGKLISLGEMLLILLALTETYSTGSWLATFGALLVFIVLVGRLRDSVVLSVVIAFIAAAGYVILSDKIAAQLAHASDQSDTSLHLATWQTALRVTLAYPWFGVGIGNQAYLNLSEPLRVAAQTKPLQEPDNTYLQWGATSGIPVMLIFLALLGSVFVSAWRNWLKVDVRYRVLFAAGIASLLALSINSLTADGWTSPIDMPFLGWLIAGIVTSPLLGRRLLHPSTSPLLESRKGRVDSPEPEPEGSTLERRSEAESVV